MVEFLYFEQNLAFFVVAGGEAQPVHEFLTAAASAGTFQFGDGVAHGAFRVGEVDVLDQRLTDDGGGGLHQKFAQLAGQVNSG